MVDVCGCELPTNLQNFTQKDNQSENIPKSFWGATFLKHLIAQCCGVIDLCGPSMGHGEASVICTGNEQAHVAASIDSNTHQHAPQLRL